MDKEIQSETISTWAQKTDLEKALTVGMHGAIEFKHDEKIYYLGELKENVIRLLSKKQVVENLIYQEIIQALKDKRATKMIIDGSINIRFIEKYKKLAIEMDKPYTVRNDPEFKGTSGLIIVSDEAADIADISVKDRSVRLQELGMSPALINSVGKKVCKKCLGQIQKADPSEASNYDELTFLDRISGESCPVHDAAE
ncbi:MAG: YueI family protein [Sporomusaceae bacterium]|nr:YueI family protein [Sporomusaceae bacterium]